MRASSRLLALNLFLGGFSRRRRAGGDRQPPPPHHPLSVASAHLFRRIPQSFAAFVGGGGGVTESQFWKFVIQFDNLIYKLDSTIN